MLGVARPDSLNAGADTTGAPPPGRRCQARRSRARRTADKALPAPQPRRLRAGRPPAPSSASSPPATPPAGWKRIWAWTLPGRWATPWWRRPTGDVDFVGEDEILGKYVRDPPRVRLRRPSTAIASWIGVGPGAQGAGSANRWRRWAVRAARRPRSSISRCGSRAKRWTRGKFSLANRRPVRA